MADNIPITVGSGTSVATDDVGGIHYQRVKVALGADGSASDAVAGAGIVGAGVQRVTLADDDPAVAALETLSGSVTSSRVGVNVISGQAGVAGGAGAVGASVQRMTLASDDPAVTALQIIDDWDETDRAKVNLIVGQAGIAAGAGAVAATVPRVTLASDDPLVAAMTRGVTVATSTITRPADTSQYTAGDALSNSTSAPTAGGGTLTIVAASGKSALMTHMQIVSSNAPGTPLQGEVWLFGTAPTAINDNAAFTVSDSEMLTCVGVIPFVLLTIGANSSATVDVGKAFATSGSTNLRYLVRVVNTYTPASGETLTVRAFCQGLN